MQNTDKDKTNILATALQVLILRIALAGKYHEFECDKSNSALMMCGFSAVNENGTFEIGEQGNEN